MGNIFEIEGGVYKNYNFAVYSTENPNYPQGTSFCNDFDGVLNSVKICTDTWNYSIESVKVIRKNDNKEIPISVILDIEEKINDIKKSIENN